MFAAPGCEVLADFLSLWEDEDGSAMALITEALLPMETSRRRPLETHPALLVDVSWNAASSFRRPVRARTTEVETHSSQVDGVIARPEASGAQAAADNWVAEAKDELLAEYVTAESDPPAAAGPTTPVPPPVTTAEDPSAELARLPRARGLFQHEGEALTAEDWDRSTSTQVSSSRSGGSTSCNWTCCRRTCGAQRRRGTRGCFGLPCGILDFAPPARRSNSPVGEDPCQPSFRHRDRCPFHRWQREHSWSSRVCGLGGIPASIVSSRSLPQPGLIFFSRVLLVPRPALARLSGRPSLRFLTPLKWRSPPLIFGPVPHLLRGDGRVLARVLANAGPCHAPHAATCRVCLELASLGTCGPAASLRLFGLSCDYFAGCYA